MTPKYQVVSVVNFFKTHHVIVVGKIVFCQNESRWIFTTRIRVTSSRCFLRFHWFSSSEWRARVRFLGWLRANRRSYSPGWWLERNTFQPTKNKTIQLDYVTLILTSSHRCYIFNLLNQKMGLALLLYLVYP